MGKVLGIDILVKINTGTEGAPVWTAIGAQQDATLNRSAGVITVSTKEATGWVENIAGLKEWSIDCDALLLDSDSAFTKLEECFNARTRVQVQFTRTGKTYQGYAFITDFPIEAPVEGCATISITLTGDGALT